MPGGDCDNDGIGDAADGQTIDTDGDGLLNACDSDSDGDGNPNFRDSDADRDAVFDAIDDRVGGTLECPEPPAAAGALCGGCTLARAAPLPFRAVRATVAGWVRRSPRARAPTRSREAR